MTLGIACLLCDDPEAALGMAQRLDELNRERRQIEADMQAQAQIDLEDFDRDGLGDLGRRRTITLFREGWHPGVVGLIASRVKERHHRPSIAFARVDAATLRGSGRSIEGVHLRDTLDRVSKIDPTLLQRFGGHAMAAGLTIGYDALERFTLAFEQAAAANHRSAACMRAPWPSTGRCSRAKSRRRSVEALDKSSGARALPTPLFANEFEVLEPAHHQGQPPQTDAGSRTGASGRRSGFAAPAAARPRPRWPTAGHRRIPRRASHCS